MKAEFDFGMVGIGVMGSNLLLNMADKGYAVIGFDLKQERATRLEEAAGPGTRVRGTTDIREMVRGLKTPRKIMMLVPAGRPVDDVVENLKPLLQKGDILIDGGNSFFRDTMRRISDLQSSGIHFFGMGISGGEMGARTGPSMMPGGDQEAWQYLRPVLESIAAKADGKPCVAYMGNHAAGHYVKMVHNGIEYAIMQMISEVYDLLHRGASFSNKQLHELFARWNEGQLQSFLMEVTSEVFNTLDNETGGKDDFLIDKILDQAGSKGTGKWTSTEAMDLPVPVPSIDIAVSMRDISVYKKMRTAASGLYQKKISTFSVNDKLLKTLENGLVFGYTMAYAQGLAMLAKASEVHNMQIHLPSVIDVWKDGCIIRSALLGNFEKAFAGEPALPNVLLDSAVCNLVSSREKDCRTLVTMGIDAGIPVACMASAITYYDAFLSERLPMNLVQAQRDYFGAHTYRRTDREGVFHTEWVDDSKENS